MAQSQVPRQRAAVPPSQGASPVEPAQGTWTVMVFMGTHTIEGHASLEAAALDDIAEMTSVGSGDGVDIFVQVHGSGTPVRHHIGQGTRVVPAAERVLEGGDALMRFIAWALATARHREQDHSLLVLWGHAYDFAIGRAPTVGGIIDPLDFAEISTVLRSLQDRLRSQYESSARPRLDIVGFDACDLSTVEVAWQLAPFARYLLASQVGVPIPGWPYDRILDRLRRPKGLRMAPPELGAYVVRRFCDAYPPQAPVSLTLLNLDAAQDVFVHAQVLAMVLASSVGTSDACRRMAAIFEQSQTSERKPFVDLADLCVGLIRGAGDPAVVEAARALGDVLAGVKTHGVGKREQADWRPFVVEHGRNNGQGARLNGVSIYAPHLAPHLDLAAARMLYHRLNFATDTVWSQLVHALLHG